MFKHAIARLPGDNFADGVTRVDLGRADIGEALRQHAAYIEALRTCGLTVEVLPADPAHPDGTFVEDTAIVLPGEAAILCRPGADSRRGEVDAVATALRRNFPQLDAITAPGTVDGGDICEAGDHVFIGISHRTNEAGAQQLAAWLQAQGRSSSLVDIRGLDTILHLKSGIACLAGKRLLLIRELAGHPAFAGFACMLADDDEAYAANAVQVNERVLIAAGHPKLAAALREHGYRPLELAMGEFAKLDGGLSCLSLRF